MRLIVGLGNPGERYEHTRHNVGFDVITLLSQRLNIPITRLRYRALIGEGQLNGEKIVLCKPQTYMNLSGEAVQELLNWYKTPPQNLLVVYDDIDLAPGWLRIRRDGSAGTHNGMRSIVSCIGTEAFPRMRVGIGGKPEPFELADWVLSRYNTPEDRQMAFDAYKLAGDAILDWIANGVDSAMNRYNTKKPKRVREKHPRPVRDSGAAQALQPALETVPQNALPQDGDTAVSPGSD